MTRTLASVRRVSKPYGSPFLGLSVHNDPRLIGPMRCVDCENVILSHGTIRKRYGFDILGDTGLADLLVEALTSYSYIHIPHNTQDSVRGIGHLALSKSPQAGPLHFLYELRDGIWEFLLTIPTSSDLREIPGFEQVAQTAKSTGSSSGHDSVIYILDGTSRFSDTTPMIKKSGGPFLEGNQELATTSRIGIAAPINVVRTGGLTRNYTFAISLSDRTQAPVDTPAVDPGQESNANFLIANATTGTELTIQFDAIEQYRWTHARIYALDVDAAETEYKFWASFSRGGLGDTSEADNLVQVDPNTWKIVVSASTMDDISRNDGKGAYSQAPTRNHPPRNMRYFAAFHGRGFWAARGQRFVSYSDPVGPNSGGHYESLSFDFLPPADGPVTMLANFYDQLVIGTPRGLTILVGAISSHTNGSIARGEPLPRFSANIEPLSGASIGPVLNGTGSHVLADGRLYFISENGLERYDGKFVVNVSQAIRDREDAPLGDTLVEAELVHDIPENIIYLFIPASTGQAARMFCYHYRILDPDTGVGAWTRWRSKVADQDMIAIGNDINDPGDPGHVIVATNNPGPPVGSLIRVQRAASSSDTLFPTLFRPIPWFWKTGRINFGISERRKQFFFTTIDIERNEGVMRVGHAFDEADPEAVAADRTQQASKLKLPTAGYGDEMSLYFGSLQSVNHSRIAGFAIDALPVDGF